MKKIITTLCAIALIHTSVIPTMATEMPETPAATSAIVVEQNSGRVLYEYNAHEERAPASITKIMTMLLVMEAIDRGEIRLDDVVTTSTNASEQGGSQIWLMTGEEMSVYDMLKATAIVSANDCAVALAEHVAGSEEAFADMMNQRALSLGMNNTHFASACGLDTENHYTTAYDISIMARELLKHDLIKEFALIWMDSVRDGASMLVNTNKMINNYEGITGLKTGTTDNAGSCFTGSATRDGVSIVTVVLNTATSDGRFDETKKLMDWAFDNYEIADIPPVSISLPSISVTRGMAEEVAIIPEPPSGIFLPKDSGEIIQQLSLDDELEAPISKGQIVGTVMVSIGDEYLLSYNVVTTESVERMTMVQALLRVLGQVVRMGG